MFLGTRPKSLSSYPFIRRLPMANVVCICRLLQFSIREVFFRCCIHLAAGRCLSRFATRGAVTQKSVPDTRRCWLEQRAQTDSRRLGKTTEHCLDVPHSSSYEFSPTSRYRFTFYDAYRLRSKLFAVNLPIDVGSEDSHGVPVRPAPWLAFASSSCRSVCGSTGAVTIRVIGRGLLYGSGA